MTTAQTAPESIDEYIAGFPNDVQVKLEQIRATIRTAAPDAEETMSYHMPTFSLRGHYLIHFSAFKKHIGLYPAPIGIEEFREELSAYAASKSTLQLPLDQPIPLELICRIVAFRVADNLTKAVGKAKKRKAIAAE